MKKTILWVFALTMILFIACNNQVIIDTDNPYIGAWEMISTKTVSQDSTYEVNSFTSHTVKLVTKKHYAFGRQTGDTTIIAGGGEYSYNDSSITTYPEYHSSSTAVGKSIRWKSKIEGDLWTISIDTLGSISSETWRRITE